MHESGWSVPNAHQLTYCQLICCYKFRHFSTTVCTVAVCVLVPVPFAQKLILQRRAKGILRIMPQIQSRSAADFCPLQ